LGKLGGMSKPQISDEAVEAALEAFLAENDLHLLMRSALEAAAPYMLAEAFAYGWREGAGIATPVDLETGEPMHDQAAQPAWNPYKERG